MKPNVNVWQNLLYKGTCVTWVDANVIICCSIVTLVFKYAVISVLNYYSNTATDFKL